MTWLIRRVLDPACEPLYWSNELGWTWKPYADVFTDADRAAFDLPMGGVWEAV